MSGPVSPPLTVKESDGSVSVRPTNTISFNAAYFTVSGTGSEATISIDSTGTGAALTATQIGFGNGSNVMTSSNLLVFLDTPAGNEALGVGLAAPNEYSSNATTVQIHDSTTAELRLTNSTTGSSGTVGQLLQAFQDDLYIFNAEASGKMFFSTNKTERMQITATGEVGIGATSPDSTAQLHVLDASHTSPILIENTQTSTDSTVNIVKFYRNATGADGNTIGGFVFNAKDDGGTAADFASIKATISDASAGSRQGKIEWAVRGGNFQLSKMTMTASEVVINQDSFGSPSFRCESNGNQNMFKVDSEENLVGVGAAPITTLKSDPPFQVLNQSAPASYEYLASSGTSPEQLTNNEMQGVMFAHASASAHTYALPGDGGVKGQRFYFFSTDGNITLDPPAGDTINGGSAGSTATFSTNNQIYHCVCYVDNTWIVSPPT